MYIYIYIYIYIYTCRSIYRSRMSSYTRAGDKCVPRCEPENVQRWYSTARFYARNPQD